MYVTYIFISINNDIKIDIKSVVKVLHSQHKRKKYDIFFSETLFWLPTLNSLLTLGHVSNAQQCSYLIFFSTKWCHVRVVGEKGTRPIVEWSEKWRFGFEREKTTKQRSVRRWEKKSQETSSSTHHRREVKAAGE